MHCWTSRPVCRLMMLYRPIQIQCLCSCGGGRLLGCCWFVFAALHVMQMRYCDENSVRLSVCLSVTRVNCDKTVERSVQIYIPYERTFSLVFWEEEWLVGGDPFYVKFWVNRSPLARNRQFSTNNRSYSSSAVTPSEKSSINANRKSTTRFPMSLR